MEGTNFFTEKTSLIDVALTDEKGNARLIKCTVAGLPTGAGYATGCIAMTEAGALYVNTGTATVASFVVIGTIAANSVVTTAIKNANVTLEKLAAGITPSHVVKFAGTSEAFAGGSTSTAITITGALSTDIATAVIRASTNAVSIVKAVLTADTLTVTFSGDPGADTTIDYSILRAAA